jgi:hypothetical protein
MSSSGLIPFIWAVSAGNLIAATQPSLTEFSATTGPYLFMVKLVGMQVPVRRFE